MEPEGAANDMAVITEQAIVLRLTEYSETSQIATLFTASHGQLRLIAKGARKSTKTRIATGLDLLECGELRFMPTRGDSQLATLTEWIQLEPFLGMRARLPALHAAFYIAELTARLTVPQDGHPGLFRSLHAVLAALDQGAAALAAVVAFQRRLLDAIGLTPNLDACVRCGRGRRAGQGAYFSSQAGGLVCRSCASSCHETIRLRAAVLDQPETEAVASARFALFAYHLQYQAGRQFTTEASFRTAVGVSEPPR